MENNSRVKHFCKSIFKRCPFIGLCCVSFILVCSSAVYAQNNTVSGTVTDAKTGKTIPGVNILVVGTTSGTSTDSVGHYTVTVPTLQDTLRFSFIGYKSQSIPIKGRRTLNVKLFQTLIAASKNLVVIGYGKERKAAITGAISTVKTPELVANPAPDLRVALAGRLPGLTVIQTSGEPGADATQLFIRGRSTVNGSNPLILVDGVQQPSIRYVDPNAVADVTILKDATATAVYGVRGANGVILITTKRGHKGKPTVNLSADYGLQDFTEKAPIIYNSFEWALLKNQAARASGSNPVYNDYALQQFKKGGNPLYPDINWRNEILRNFAPKQRYNLNFGGGAAGGNVIYFVDVNYLHQGGQWKTHQPEYNTQSYLRRYNFRSNIDANLSSSTQIRLNLAGVVQQINRPSASYSMLQILAALHQAQPTQLGGVLTPNKQVLKRPNAALSPIYGVINRMGFNRSTRSMLTSTFRIKQNLSSFVPGLSARLRASFNTRSVRALVGTQDFERWTATPDPTDSSKLVYSRLTGNNTPLNLSNSYNFRSRTVFLGRIDYDHTFFSKHHITALLLGKKKKTIKPAITIPFNLIGLSTRLTYSYSNKYFFQFDGGYNGSEQFSKGNRYGFFPAVSAGWLISNENFLQNNSVLTHLKLRGSYGLVGSDLFGKRRFLYLTHLHLGGNVASPSLIGSINLALQGNPNLTWEINHTADIGLEIGLYNQVHLSVDVYKEHRTNVLVGSVAPALGGVPLGTLPPVNQGIIDNKGYEIVLKYNTPPHPNFSLNAQINFDYAKNKIIKLNEVKRKGNYAFPFQNQGFSIGQVFGYKIDRSINGGYFKNQKQIDNYATYQGIPAPRPGDFIYKDLNGDDTVSVKDLGPIGYPHVPLYNFGASISLKYKSFDFSFLVQGVADVSSDPRQSGRSIYDIENFYKWHRNAWTPERQALGIPFSYPRLSLNSNSSSTVTNNFWIEHTGFLRLKNVDIGYTLPARWTKVIDASQIRFFVNGVNLWLIWNNETFKGYDPELAEGLTYPIYRTFTAGIDLKF
jgi:TonB-linked SusC/RagA family outer membrane protein